MAESTRRPNVVFILADDMGYGDFSAFNGGLSSTPTLDALIGESVCLTQQYTASPVCNPSRAALMTGCYPRRVGMATGSTFVVLLAGDRKGLHPNEITMAEMLKKMFGNKGD